MGTHGTHYDVLGLQPSATADEIEDQYRALAKVVHPDVGGDAITFATLAESYDVLSDPDRRSAYDRSLTAAATRRRPLAVPFPIFRRPSPAALRARALRRAHTGRLSWHLTPRELAFALWRKAIYFAVGIAMFVLLRLVR